MKIWLIRHAEAEDRETFDGPDSQRPLTRKGIERSNISFAKLADIYNAPDLVFSSQAVRAWQTADCFCQAFGLSAYKKTPLLNPGASPTQIKRVVEGVPPDSRFLVLIGHEPDFSKAVSQWAADGALNIILKKGGLVALDIDEQGNALVRMIIPPRLLTDL